MATDLDVLKKRIEALTPKHRLLVAAALLAEGDPSSTKLASAIAKTVVDEIEWLIRQEKV